MDVGFGTSSAIRRVGMRMKKGIMDECKEVQENMERSPTKCEQYGREWLKCCEDREQKAGNGYRKDEQSSRIVCKGIRNLMFLQYMCERR